jgi:hypothetical protein
MHNIQIQDVARNETVRCLNLIQGTYNASHGVNFIFFHTG